jgi:hypothetical protein
MLSGSPDCDPLTASHNTALVGRFSLAEFGPSSGSFVKYRIFAELVAQGAPMPLRRGMSLRLLTSCLSPQNHLTFRLATVDRASEAAFTDLRLIRSSRRRMLSHQFAAV